jgi:hypothetical protein
LTIADNPLICRKQCIELLCGFPSWPRGYISYCTYLTGGYTVTDVWDRGAGNCKCEYCTLFDIYPLSPLFKGGGPDCPIQPPPLPCPESTATESQGCISLSLSSPVLQLYIREEMAAQPPPPPPPPTPSFSFSAPTPVGENSGPLQKIAALQHQARQEATPPGYFGPMYSPSLQSVAPEGAGRKVPPSWGQSANSFLQGSPLPQQQLQPPAGGVQGTGGQVSSSQI